MAAYAGSRSGISCRPSWPRTEARSMAEISKMSSQSRSRCSSARVCGDRLCSALT
ncbi:predicted protein [Streptomyces iranensis]|uniref:Uncharacterized protein n=1 Tax=Streptomyces iranensis TaxID=576784 RepID=A0A060ZFU6_9ACTN|nr:predicted protein [Streptomyces iranensis]